MTTQRDPVTTTVNTHLTVTYRRGGTATFTLEDATYVNTWLGQSFDGTGSVYAFMQFEAHNGDYISILADQIVSIKAGVR